jgi:acetyl esterase/lipase
MKKGFNWAKDRETLLLERARRVVYAKTPEGAELALHFFLPKSYGEGGPHPVMLFFHGGLWDRPGLVQFAPHALYYVERGVIAALVEYRTASKHPGSRPSDAQGDGRAAIRYVRRHAGEINADPGKLIVVGAGSGANLAGAALLNAPVTGAEAPAKPSDSRPDAGVLLSAIFDVEKGGPGFDRCGSTAEAKQVSLSRFIESGAPPMLVVHGNADRFVPVEDAIEFAAKMERKRNPCRFLEFEGRDREFFQFNLDPVSYEATLAEIDRFLDEHDLLKRREGDPGPHLISWREGDF